jgi:hypothetical protein
MLEDEGDFDNYCFRKQLLRSFAEYISSGQDNVKQTQVRITTEMFNFFVEILSPLFSMAFIGTCFSCSNQI